MSKYLVTLWFDCHTHIEVEAENEREARNEAIKEFNEGKYKEALFHSAEVNSTDIEEI